VLHGGKKLSERATAVQRMSALDVQLDGAETSRASVWEGVDEARRSTLSGPVRTVTDPYTMGCAPFEVFECLRKIALIGLPSLFPVGSDAQLIFGYMVCFLSFGVYLKFMPYREWSDNAVAIIAQAQIFFTLLAALVLKQSAATGESYPMLEAALLISLLVTPAATFMPIRWLRRTAAALDPRSWVRRRGAAADVQPKDAPGWGGEAGPTAAGRRQSADARRLRLSSRAVELQQELAGAHQPQQGGGGAARWEVARREWMSAAQRLPAPNGGGASPGEAAPPFEQTRSVGGGLFREAYKNEEGRWTESRRSRSCRGRKKKLAKPPEKLSESQHGGSTSRIALCEATRA
jgi:hypothetical protein